MTTPEAQETPQPDKREDLSPTTQRRLPTKFDERHEKAWLTYLGLGPERTYKKVAEIMGLSDRTIGDWAAAYHWKERLHNTLEDQKKLGLIEHFGQIASIRGDGVVIVSNVMSIMRQVTEIIQAASEESRDLTKEEMAQIKTRQGYLTALGVQLKTPKDLRDLVNIVGEVIEFQPGSGGGQLKTQPDPDKPKGGNVIVEGPCLIIQGLEPEKTAQRAVKELMGDKVPALRGSDQCDPPPRT